MDILFIVVLILILLTIFILQCLPNIECPNCHQTNTYVIKLYNKTRAEIGCRNCYCVFPAEID